MNVRRWGLVIGAMAWLAGLALAAAVPLVAARWPVLIAGLALFVVSAGASLAAILGYARRYLPVPRALAWGLLALWLAASFALGVARLTWANPAIDPANVSHLIGSRVAVQGTVSGEPDPRAKGEYITIAVSSLSRGNGYAHPATGTVEVYALGPASEFMPDYGDTVTVSGVLSPTPAHAPPGIDASLGAATVVVVQSGGGNPLWAALAHLRLSLAGAIAASMPAPEAALLIGILLGLKTPVLRERLALFTRTGTIHLVVTSGLKVTLVAGIVAALVRRLPRGAQMALSLTAITLYVTLSGAGPAALRAGIMGAILVLARALRRDYDVFSALALAALIMTAVTPAILWDVGFQLSAAGTLGIALWGPRFGAPLVRWLGRVRGGATLAEVLATTIAAQLATLPLVALNFGIVSLVAPVTNAILVPLLPLFLALGALVGTLGLIAAPLGAVAGAIAWPVARLADLVIEQSAALPWAALTVGGVPAWVTPLWVAAVAGLARLWPRRDPAAIDDERARRLPWQLRVGIALAVLLTLFAGSLGLARASAPAGALTVTFLDVPGGPATVIRLANGRTVLIDGGADGPSLVSALGSVLPFWQHTIDLILVTDVRAGHLAGLSTVLGSYRVAEVGDPGDLHPDTAYIAWYTNVRRVGIPRVQISAGRTIDLGGGAEIDVLSPALPLSTTAPYQDQNAMILVLVTPGLRVLFAGDASDLALAGVMSQPAALHTDLVQVCQTPNEGILYATPLSDLLAVARPRLVVVTPSARSAPKAGTPDAAPTPDDPAALAGGITVARTWQSGQITIATEGSDWWLAH